jgi:hypothetical protein
VLCHSVAVDGLLGAIIGLAVAAVLALINSWLTNREKVEEGVRDQRIRTYPSVWERTGVVSRWPRTDATREHASHLHLDLRTWYYSGGGLFLSEDARARYEHLQVLLEAIVAHEPDEPLTEYDELADAAHWFREGLAEDLRIRHGRNALVAWADRRRRQGEVTQAVERERRVGAQAFAEDGSSPRRATARTPRVMLTDDDEILRRPETQSSGS